MQFCVAASEACDDGHRSPGVPSSAIESLTGGDTDQLTSSAVESLTGWLGLTACARFSRSGPARTRLTLRWCLGNHEEAFPKIIKKFMAANYHKKRIFTMDLN
jgi:hypothetical protein